MRHRPSTPSERGVAVYAGAFVLALMGCTVLYFAWFRNAPPDAAAQLRNIGLSCFGLAGGIVLCRWIVGLFIDG
jgi:hypothetical protein